MSEERAQEVPDGTVPEQVSSVVNLNNYCTFCGLGLNRDEPENYREVVSWVTGPKLDHPVMRTQTGRMAHKNCVDKARRGQAPDQPEIDL